MFCSLLWSTHAGKDGADKDVCRPKKLQGNRIARLWPGLLIEGGLEANRDKRALASHRPRASLLCLWPY